MRKNKHLHRFERRDIGSKVGPNKKKFVVFACNKPECSYYIRADLVEGKLSECNICGKPMVMTKEAMTRVTTRCTACVRRKAPVGSIQDYLKDRGLE